jgi:hypothetical protein
LKTNPGCLSPKCEAGYETCSVCKERREMFARVRTAYSDYMLSMRVLAGCPHEIGPRDPDILEKLKRDKWACTSAICLHCRKSMGWWCPASPSQTCDYEHPDGRYDDDDCIYCHGPEERK